MFCDRCGTQVAEPARFCPNCGKGVGVVPMMPPPQGRIAGHVRLLGIFWLAISAFHLIPGLVLLSIFGHPWFFPADVPAFVHGWLSVIGGFFLFGAILGILAGWGLIQREPWARTLAIVLACFSLLSMPFGTAIGIYTLWVLLPAASEAEYRSAARAG